MNLEWRVIEMELHDPYTIAAMDEAILEEVDFGNSPPTLVFYNWEPSVSISSNQRLDDINLSTCKERGYKIVRMKSGGRAVIHHPPDITYSLFIPNSQFAFPPLKNPLFIYNLYCEKIASALRGLGLPTEVKHNNDIYVNGKKLSGNAQRITKNTVMQHGIILYELPNPKEMLELMNPALYNGDSVEILKKTLTAVSCYKKDSQVPLTHHTLIDSLIKNLIGELYKTDNLTEREKLRLQELIPFYLDPEKDITETTVRGLCWLPAGTPLGTYKGENPYG